MEATNGKLREYETAKASEYDPAEAARAKAIWEAGKPVDVNFYPLPERTTAAAVPADLEKEKRYPLRVAFNRMMAAAQTKQAPAATAQSSAARIEKLADYLGGRYVGRRRR